MTQTFTYQGQWLSLNQLYSKNRFAANNLKSEWKERFRALFKEADFKPVGTFKLHVRYNSRMDCDNLTGGTKVLCDTLRSENLVPNDDKRYYKGITIEPDVTLKHNTYVITVLGE